MTETKFNPSEVKCLSNTIMIETFVNNEFKVGDKVLYKTDQAAKPEYYALVHSVGPQVTDVKPGDYVLLKPLRKPLYKIKNSTYCFVAYYDLEAVIPKEYLEFFRNHADQPNNNLEG